MRRVSLTLLGFVLVLVVLVGMRYQWAKTHRPARAVSTSQRDSLHRDTTANGSEPADTMCLASRIGFPCDNGVSRP